MGWQKVSEGLPAMSEKTYMEGGTYLQSEYVLVWDGETQWIAQATIEKDKLWWIDQLAGNIENVTAWTPLPEDPTE